MDKEDIYLIEEAKKDHKKFEDIYKKYSQKIFNYFWFRVGHQKDVAEDLMQETFIRAYKDLDKFNLRTHSYYSYLLTIAHNLLVNYYRKNKIIPLESVDTIPNIIIPEEEIDKKENLKLLWKAIQELPQPEKDIFFLKYKEDLPIKEIAKIVDKSENAVKLILSRTRKKLINHPYFKYITSFKDYQKKYTKPKFFKKIL